MIEMGVALIAACLPTLRPFFHEVSIESVVRSVRSKLSLESVPSRSRSSTTKDDGPRTSHDSRKAFASKTITAEIAGDDDYLETHIMTDIETNRNHHELNDHKINVRKDLMQSVEQV